MQKNWANNINQEYISSKVVFTNLRNRITSRRSFCFLQNIFCPIWYTSVWLFLLLYSITNALQRNVACLTIFRVKIFKMSSLFVPPCLPHEFMTKIQKLTDGHGHAMLLDSLYISIQRFWVLKKNIQSKFYFFCSSKRVSIQLLSYICFSEVNKRR